MSLRLPHWILFKLEKMNMLILSYFRSLVLKAVVVFLSQFYIYDFQNAWAQDPATQNQIPLTPREVIDDGIRQQEEKDKGLQKKLEAKEDILILDKYEEITTNSIRQKLLSCGIPRSTLYRWINRYKNGDEDSLKDKYKKPIKLAKQKLTQEIVYSSR